jgi:hypothetical protein
MAAVALNETPRWLAEYEPALANLSGVLPPIQRLLVTQARLIYLRLLDDLAAGRFDFWPHWLLPSAGFFRAELVTPTCYGMVIWEESGWCWQRARN